MNKRSMIVTFLLLCLTAVAGYGQDKPAPKAEEKPAAKAEAKPAAGDAKARAQQVLTAARQAKGSAEKLKAARDLTERAEGNVNIQGQSIDITVTSYIQVPDKGRTEINIPVAGQTIVQTINGANGWMEMGGGAQDMPGEVLTAGKHNLARGWFTTFLMAPDGKEVEATALEDAQVNGKPADVLAVTLGDAKLTIYFDKQTHLALKTAYETLNPQMETVKAESLYDDYKDVNGIKLAHKETIYQAGEKFLDVKLIEAKVNAGVEAAKFTKQ